MPTILWAPEGTLNRLIARPTMPAVATDARLMRPASMAKAIPRVTRPA